MHRAFHDTFQGRLPGLLLAGVASIAIMQLANLPSLLKLGFSSLTLAIVLGMVLGNTVFGRVAPQCGAGVDFSKSTLLRLGVILYGFRITFGQIAQVGWGGILMDAL
ncbi:MAG: putative sulfate exporter family transporter, partial [Betaproteobacteria bacterium]|nr:putative sulfate exporter family transporter [Betaproteobacteria bacterium]